MALRSSKSHVFSLDIAARSSRHFRLVRYNHSRGAQHPANVHQAHAHHQKLHHEHSERHHDVLASVAILAGVLAQDPSVWQIRSLQLYHPATNPKVNDTDGSLHVELATGHLVQSTPLGGRNLRGVLPQLHRTPCSSSVENGQSFTD